jgi:hypothetical protein
VNCAGRLDWHKPKSETPPFAARKMGHSGKTSTSKFWFIGAASSQNSITGLVRHSATRLRSKVYAVI